jgi:hypothetical protein
MRLILIKNFSLWYDIEIVNEMRNLTKVSKSAHEYKLYFDWVELKLNIFQLS